MKPKKFRRLTKYLDGGQIPAGVSDYGLGTLLSLSAGAVADLVDTIQMDVTPYHLKQNAYEGGGLVEVEGQEVFESPDGQMGKFKGPSHENGGIPVALPDGTAIYSKRIKGPDGRSMAKRKESRERQLNKLMRKFEKNPEDQILKNTLQRTAIVNQIEDTHDIAVMEAMRKVSQFEDQMKAGGIYIKPSKRGTFTAAAKKRGMGVQEFAGKVLANKSNYSTAMVKKANFAKNASKWKHADGGIVEVKKGDTLWNIAKQHGMDWKELASANSIDDPRKLQVGTKLRIPGAEQPQQEETYSGGYLPEAVVTAKRKTTKPSVKESSLYPGKSITRSNQSDIIRPTVGGSYRSGNVSVDQLKQFKQDHPDVKSIVLLRGANEGVSKEQLEKAGFNVSYLPIGKLSTDGEKKNFRKAVDKVKQGNTIVMCKHGYDRTGAVVGQAALEMGYSMDDVVSHNLWKEGKAMYPNVSGKGESYRPYMDILQTPEKRYRDEQERPLKESLRRYATGGLTEDQMMDVIYKCGGLKKMQTGGIATEPQPGEPDYEARLALFRYMRDNPGGAELTQLNTEPAIAESDLGPSMIPLTEKPEIKTVGPDWGKGLIENPYLTSVLDTLPGIKFKAEQSTPDWGKLSPGMSKDGKPVLPEQSLSSGADAEGLGMENLGDKLGFVGTGISAVAPGIMTLLNRVGDEKTPNFMEGFGDEALRTQEQGLQYLKAAEDQAKLEAQLAFNQAKKEAAGNLRSTSQLQSNLSGLAASEATQKGRISGRFAESMMGQLNRLSGMQLETDRIQRAGKQESFLANQADRDNFFTQFNADLVNLGTGVQKSGADLNAMKLNEDILSLLPEISAYGIGVRRKPGGGYELYETE